MRPSETQRKVALIISYAEKNQVFPKDIETRNHTSDILGLTKNTLENWLKGKIPSTRKIADFSLAVSNLVNDINPDIEIEVSEQYLKNTGVMRLGQLLGLERSECRKSIDQKISSIMSTYSIFNVDDDSARATWKELAGRGGGHYIMYRVENTEITLESNGGNPALMQIPIAVRHVIKGNKPMSKGFQKIRAKAHIYNLTGAESYFDYDGYITRKDGAGFYHWLFQSRNQTTNDLLYLITGDLERHNSIKNPEAEKRLFILGTLHTRNQDSSAKSGAWPVILEKIDLNKWVEQLKSEGRETWGNFDDADSYFMRAAPRLIDISKVDEAIVHHMRRANQRLQVHPFPVD